MKVLVITDDGTPDSVKFYRTVGVLPWIEKGSGRSITFDFKPIQTVREIDLYHYDAILPEKYYAAPQFQFITLAKQAGCKVWIDDDDSRLDIPKGNWGRKYYLVPENRARVEKALEFADLITVTTPMLKKMYRGYNKNIHIIPNAWNDYRYSFQETKPQSKPARIIWRGGDRHNPDLNEVRKPLTEIYARRQEFDFRFIGHSPDYIDLQQHEEIPFQTISSYFNLLYRIGGDFLFIPLKADEDFNKAKSNIGLIEALLVGMPVIAPLGLPEFDRDGVIHYKDNADLLKVFARITQKQYDKTELVSEGRQWMEEIRLSKINALRIEAIGTMWPEVAQMAE